MPKKTTKKGSNKKAKGSPTSSKPKQTSSKLDAHYVIKPSQVYTSYPYTSYKPTCVGSFCSDKMGEIIHVNDSSVFPRLKIPEKLPLDLNTGTRTPRTPSSTILFRRILKWIIHTGFDVSSVSVVARRGILKHIGYTLYNRYKNPWSFKLCKYRGVVYLYEPATTTTSQSSDSQPWLYWGCRYEELVTSRDNVTSSKEGELLQQLSGSSVRFSGGSVKWVRDGEEKSDNQSIEESGGKEGVTTGTCNISEIKEGLDLPDHLIENLRDNVQSMEPSSREEEEKLSKIFQKKDPSSQQNEPYRGAYTMVTGKISHVSVLLCGEVDAVCPETGELVEIKTCTERKLPDRLCFGWTQSFLAGVGQLHFGLRDGEGVVHKTRTMKVGDAVRGAKCWDPAGVMGLIGGVIRWVVGTVPEGFSGALLYMGEGEILLSAQENEGHFLPEWYTSSL